MKIISGSYLAHNFNGALFLTNGGNDKFVYVEANVSIIYMVNFY